MFQSIDDIFETGQVLYEAAVRLVATNSTAEDRRAIVKLAATPLATADELEALDVARSIGSLISRLSGRPTLALFIGVLADLGGEPIGRRLFEDRSFRLTEERANRALARAIEAGDAHAAVKAVRATHVRRLAWAKANR